MPPKEESVLMYRGFWKKDKGFKIYKFKSIIPLNGQQ
jgi:hypothetical protein